MAARKFTVYDIVIYIFLALCAVMIIVPVWHILVISTSTAEVYMTDDFHLIPKSFSLQAYQRALYSMGGISRALLISLQVTAIGTCLSMILTSCGAYVLSKKNIPGRSIMFSFLIFTMFFSGGLVPFYILIKGLGLTDTIFALFLPHAVSTFNLIIMKNYFVSLPESLEEAAKIDGYNDVQILYKVIIPISKPVFAAISLFYAVGYWNDYFYATLFINSSKLYPLQVILRQMIIQNQMLAQLGIHTAGTNMEQFKMACIIVGMIPMLLIYPFVQKYFTKGVMLGAVKE